MKIPKNRVGVFNYDKPTTQKKIPKETPQLYRATNTLRDGHGDITTGVTTGHLMKYLSFFYKTDTT